MKTFFASVRVRKQDRNGNTYHDVQVYDTKGVIIGEAIKHYGYGTHYMQTTMDIITAKTKSKNINIIYAVHHY